MQINNRMLMAGATIGEALDAIALGVTQHLQGQTQGFENFKIRSQAWKLRQVINVRADTDRQGRTPDSTKVAKILFLRQAQANFFASFSLSCCSAVNILRFNTPARKGNISRPGIVFSFGTADKQ